MTGGRSPGVSQRAATAMASMSRLRATITSAPRSASRLRATLATDPKMALMRRRMLSLATSYRWILGQKGSKSEFMLSRRMVNPCT